MKNLKAMYKIPYEKICKYGWFAQNAYFHSYFIVVEDYFDDIDKWNALENYQETEKSFLFQKVMASEQLQIVHETPISK